MPGLFWHDRSPKEIMKRRTHPNGTGKGVHGKEAQIERKRPPGQIKPIISKSKHGKKMQTQFHDADDDIGPDFAGARRAIKGCLWVLAIIAVFAVAMCGATVAHGQTSPNVEFRSLFQIRYALPDTVQLQHVGYNIRLNTSGVECVPLNPAMGAMPAIPVQNWIIGDSGEWIGVTRSGGTVTLWSCCGADMYLEIAAASQVVDFYNMAPNLTWKERDKQ